MNLKKYSDKKKYPGYNDLKKHYPFFVLQIAKDREINDSLKYECLDEICSMPIPNIKKLTEACCAFFDRKQLIGSVCKNAQFNNSYIRVNGKDSLVAWISQIVGLTTLQVNSFISPILYSSNAILKKAFINKLLNLEAINDSYFLRDNCIKYFGMKMWKSKNKPILRDAFLTNFNFIQWSFPDSKTEDLFFDQASIDLIPCRAGLLFKGEKIIFSHNLDDSYNVRKPTVFDARLYPQFEPGGFTKPLKSCIRLNGFEEFVHKPNNFKNIEMLNAETFYKL